MKTNLTPGSSDESIKTDVRALWLNTLWALELAWSTSPRRIVAVIVFTFLRALMPAGLALAARGLLNALVGIVQRNGDDFSILLPWLLLALGLTLVQAVSDQTHKYVTHLLSDELHLRITSDILTHAASLDTAYFEDPRFHDVMERAQQNTAQHFSRFLVSILGIFNGALQTVSLFGVLVVIEPIIVLVLTLVALPCLLFQWRVAEARYVKERFRTTKRRWTRYFVRLVTGSQLAAEVKLLDLGPLLTDRYRSLMREFRDQDHDLHRRSYLSGTLFAAFFTLAFYAAFAWVAFRALKGGLTVGDVAIFAGAGSGLRNSLGQLILSISGCVEQTLYVSNLCEFLSIQPRMKSTSGVVPKSSRGEIEFKDVSFTYPGSSQKTLSDVSFHIKPGETVALVGENGAGKTTLAKLIARLYDPDTGCITFDGIDLKELSPAYLHSRISFVFQGFGRYEATAADNIAYGDWRRLMNDREGVMQVARRAKVQEMIEEMPQAYDTMLGRSFGEHDLSAGQWQKLAVARAFARDTSLLILDEPTASLDARAEYEIFSGFRELLRGRTTVLISHRFSTVSMADRVLVLDQGRIIEQGTHQELLARNGHYATLYNLHQRQLSSPVPG